MTLYRVVVYGYIDAETLEEAEEIYESGEWDLDSHVIVDEDGTEYDSEEIEKMGENNGQ